MSVKQNSKKMIKVGSKVRVTKDLSCHSFKIGEIIKIVKHHPDKIYKGLKLDGRATGADWLTREEFEIIEQ